jgi:hypothetical protein
MYGKSTEEGKTPARKDGPAPTGSGAIEERGVEFVGGAELPRIVPPRDGRVHRLVLFRTAIVLQPNRCPSISVLPGTKEPCALDDPEGDRLTNICRQRCRDVAKGN